MIDTPKALPLWAFPSRGVAQFGSASVLGTEGRWFESSRPDHDKTGHGKLQALFSALDRHLRPLIFQHLVPPLATAQPPH